MAEIQDECTISSSASATAAAAAAAADDDNAVFADSQVNVAWTPMAR